MYLPYVEQAEGLAYTIVHNQLSITIISISPLQGSLLFCDACDKGYHMQCHVPPLATMPIGEFAKYYFS